MDTPPAGPTFSVVMPAYDSASTIGAAISSVLRQTVEDFELIVVDDGSTDRTREFVGGTADPRVRLIERYHGGAAAARNAGIAAARGRVVSFVDSDDLWLPTYLERMHETLSARPDAGFAYTDAFTLDAESGRVARATAMQWNDPPAVPPTDPEEFFRLMLRANFVYNAVSVPRTILERSGGFDESLTAGIDYELWLRIIALGYPGSRAPGILGVYRSGRHGAISSSPDRVLTNLARIYRMVAANESVSSPNRERARIRAEDTEAELDALHGARTLDATWRRVKPRLARARHAILRSDTWSHDLPPELLDAFPELGGDRRR